MLNTCIAPWPVHTEKEIEAVTEVLRSGKTNQWTGSKVKEFEQKFADYLHCDHAIAVANGTVALDIILNVNRRRIKGKEVIVTSRTFVASVSSIIMAGGIPVFVDVNKDTGNITPENIQEAITDKTGAILCVHLAGMPCDMDPIMALAEKHNLFVIEDCAQAHGASYNGRKVGTIGHAAAWSFCQDKIMTTGGEGGMITTNDYHMFKAMWSYKDHGKSYEKTRVINLPSTGFKYVHDHIGSNYRMTEMQAAIGLVQLETLDDQIMVRNFLANAYDLVMNDFSAVRLAYTLDVDFTFTHAKYKHYAFVNPGGMKEGWTRDRLIQELNKAGVPCYHGSCSEVYLEDAIRDRVANKDSFTTYEDLRLPVAKRLGETSLMFLVHPNITPEDLANMKAGLQKVLTEASKGTYA